MTLNRILKLFSAAFIIETVLFAGLLYVESKDIWAHSSDANWALPLVLTQYFGIMSARLLPVFNPPPQELFINVLYHIIIFSVQVGMFFLLLVIIDFIFRWLISCYRQNSDRRG